MQMADDLELSEDMIRRYDSGRSSITLRLAERYAERLGKLLGDLLPTTQIKSSELQTFIMALQDFEPEERSEVIAKATRDLVHVSGLMSARHARHSLLQVDGRGNPPRDTPSFASPDDGEELPVHGMGAVKNAHAAADNRTTPARKEAKRR